MKIVYNIYVAVRKLWNAIFGKNGDGSQLVIPGRISGASGDVTVGDGLNLANNVMKSTVPVVSANPETAESDPELTGLMIGNNKYKVPSGGGSTLYLHIIEIFFNTKWRCALNYVSSQAEAYTDVTFSAELYSKGISVSSDKYYPAVGHENLNPIIGLQAYNNTSLSMAEYDSTTGSPTSSGAGGATFRDTVITL